MVTKTKSEKELREERKEKFEKANRILDRAEEEDRGLTAKEMRKYEQLKDEIDELNEAIGSKPSEEGLTERDRASLMGQSLNDAEDLNTFGPDEEFRSAKRSSASKGENLDFGKLLRGQILGEWRNAEKEKRALQESDDTAGGYLVPSVVSDRIINKARELTATLQAGIPTVELDSSSEMFPTVDEKPEAKIKKELEEGEATTITFGEAESRLYTIFTIVEISQELLQDAQNLGNFVENQLAQAISEEMDRFALVGDGAGEPTGILENENVLTHTVGSAIDYDEISKAYFKAVSEGTIKPRSGIWNAKVAGTLDRLKDSNDQYLDPPESFENLRTFLSSQIPNDYGTGDETKAVLGMFDNCLFGIGSRGLELRSTDTGGGALEKYSYRIAAAQRADFLVTRPSDIVVLDEIDVS